MSDYRSAISSALQQQSFLHRVREELLELDSQFSQLDEELMIAEVDHTFIEQQMCSLKEQLKQYQDQSELLKVSELDLKGRRSELGLQRFLLKDLQLLLSGEPFVLARALFFTQSLLDFATEHGMGEMSVSQMIKDRAKGMILDLDGASYAYLENQEGELFFSPKALSDSFLHLLQDLSD